MILPGDEGAGLRLRLLRERMGVSLREAARHVPCSPGYLCAVEQGKRRLTVALLGRILKALGAIQQERNQALWAESETICYTRLQSEQE